MTFTCDKNPAVTVEDGKAKRMTITKPWDGSSKTVTLSFDHADGAVNFSVPPPPTALTNPAANPVLQMTGR